MFEASPPVDVTLRNQQQGYQLDAPPPLPWQAPLPLIRPRDPALERFQYDTTPAPMGPFIPRFQLGAISPQPPYTSADLVGLLNRLYGAG